MAALDHYITVDDFRPAAKEALPADFFDYVEGGAGDEWTLAENRRAFDRWMFRPRFLRGAGIALSLPFLDSMTGLFTRAAQVVSPLAPGATPRRLFGICFLILHRRCGDEW